MERVLHKLVVCSGTAEEQDEHHQETLQCHALPVSYSSHCLTAIAHTIMTAHKTVRHAADDKIGTPCLLTMDCRRTRPIHGLSTVKALK